MDDDYLSPESLRLGDNSASTKTLSNPYDFRRPVVKSDRLVGRGRELDAIQRCLEATAQGNPVHLALIGERAAGKTSLLNIAALRAQEMDLLVVKLDLDEGVVTSSIHFFRALFEAAVGALEAKAAMTERESQVQGWYQQVYQGRLDVEPSNGLLLFGGIAAALNHGTAPDDVSPFVLKHDFDQISEFAISAGLKGVLLRLDEGDLLSAKAAIFQKLRNVLQDCPAWMLIAAGTQAMFATMSDVFSPIPRQFERISVSGLQDRFLVRQCMIRPLSGLSVEFRLPLGVTNDVMKITHGRPYEINLVAYFIWEEQYQPGDKILRVELTQAVLDNVVAELRDLSWDVSVKEVDRIRDLPPEEFEELAEVVPFQQMTVRQSALTRLLPHDFEPTELEAAESAFSRQLENLSELNVVQREGDRFRIVGDDFVQGYLKYALARHERVHEHTRGFGGLSFAEAVVDAFVPIAFDSSSCQIRTTLILRRRMSADLSRTRPRSLGQRFSEEIQARNVPEINRTTPLGLVFYDEFEETGEENGTDSCYVAIGITFQVSVVDFAEVLVLAVLKSGDADALSQDLADWQRGFETVMSKFETRVEEIVAVDVPPDLLKEVKAYSVAAQEAFISELFDRFHDGNYEAAAQIGRGAIAALEPHLRPYVGGKRYQSDQRVLADVLNRTGFLTLLHGDAEAARPLLQKRNTTVQYGPVSPGIGRHFGGDELLRDRPIRMVEE
jgi:hypothetical protein